LGWAQRLVEWVYYNKWARKVTGATEKEKVMFSMTEEEIDNQYLEYKEHQKKKSVEQVSVKMTFVTSMYHTRHLTFIGLFARKSHSRKIEYCQKTSKVKQRGRKNCACSTR
jgi:hypothetical protein